MRDRKTNTKRATALIGIVFATVLITVSASKAFSAGGVVLKSVVEVEIVATKADGTKELKRVDVKKTNVVPGSTIVFTTFYTNTDDKPATGVVIKNPVPRHMVYIADTAEGKNTRIDFSVNNEKSFGLPPSLKIKALDGKERPAAEADYTNVRWKLTGALAPGGKGSVSFKTRVK